MGVKKDENHTDLIKISDEIQIKMKYPDISFFNEGINLSSISSQIELMGRCVSQIIHGDEVYDSVDMEQKEVQDWLEELTTEQFTNIAEFFQTMPKLHHSITLKNTNTGKDFTVVLEGLQDFF